MRMNEAWWGGVSCCLLPSGMITAVSVGAHKEKSITKIRQLVPSLRRDTHPKFLEFYTMRTTSSSWRCLPRDDVVDGPRDADWLDTAALGSTSPLPCPQQLSRLSHIIPFWLGLKLRYSHRVFSQWLRNQILRALKRLSRPLNLATLGPTGRAHRHL